MRILIFVLGLCGSILVLGSCEDRPAGFFDTTEGGGGSGGSSIAGGSQIEPPTVNRTP